MAVDLAAAPPSGFSVGSVSLLEQTLAVARRSIMRTTRQRALIIFPMIFPLILFAFALASLGVLLALRFGTGEAVQGIFPLLFVTIFLSSSSLPRNLIKASWFREVATYNPVSYLLEALRSLVITGWDAQALALGFGFALALLVITLALAQRSMRSRLTRT